MCTKAMPATVYVAVSRHLSEVKLCASARAGSFEGFTGAPGAAPGGSRIPD